MSVKTMTCMSCTRTKAWPDGFPSRHYAECWQCAWNKHIYNEHPKIVRRIKREARKRTRRRIESHVREVLTRDEAMQALGISPSGPKSGLGATNGGPRVSADVENEKKAEKR